MLSTRYPCVLKPLGLSGEPRRYPRQSCRRIHAGLRSDPENSEAVQRAEGRNPATRLSFDSGGGFHSRARVRARRAGDAMESPDPGASSISRIRWMARFSKRPSIVTPSREPAAMQRLSPEDDAAGHRGAGADRRSDSRGNARERWRGWMLEVAARPIGGLCSRGGDLAVRISGMRPLEELILLHCARPAARSSRFCPPAPRLRSARSARRS